MSNGKINGMKRLVIDESGIVDIFPEASVNSKAASHMDIDSLKVLAGGTLKQSLGDKTVGKATITLTNDLTVNAYGRIDVSGITFKVGHVIVPVDFYNELAIR